MMKHQRVAICALYHRSDEEKAGSITSRSVFNDSMHWVKYIQVQNVLGVVLE